MKQFFEYRFEFISTFQKKMEKDHNRYNVSSDDNENNKNASNHARETFLSEEKAKCNLEGECNGRLFSFFLHI